ncbi:MAG: hypothetical protein NVS9B10_06750 [Nevskia sp.]
MKPLNVEQRWSIAAGTWPVAWQSGNQDAAEPQLDPVRPLRLLIVEDSADDAEIILLGLRRAGVNFESTLAADATEFMQALAAAPDVIVCDYRMPSFGAIEALRLLAEHAPEIPLIVVSRYVGEDTAVGALHLGAVDYLLKDRLARLPQALARAVALARLSREQAQAKLELEQVNRGLSVLSARLLSIQDEERARIARELHDQLGHTLTAAKFQLKSLVRTAAAIGAGDAFDSTLTLLDLAMSEVRNLSTSLFPPQLKLIGLGVAIEALVRQWRSVYDGGIEVSIPDPLPPLGDTLLIAAYRIVQEAMTNAIRHASARRIVVAVAVERSAAQDAGALRLSIRDDGRGFDVEQALRACADGRSIGLTSLQQRAELVGGTVEFVSRRGFGCLLHARLPLLRIPAP